MGMNSGDGYYQDADEARYYDSWEGDRDVDYDLNHRDPNWRQPPDSYYRDRHVPAKVAIMRSLHEGEARRVAEEQARKVGGRLSDDGKTILIPVMTETEKVEAQDRYAINKAAKVGATIACACCGKKFTKRSYQQAFCSNKGRDNCKDKYWNVTVPSRAARANQYLGVQEMAKGKKTETVAMIQRDIAKLEADVTESRDAMQHATTDEFRAKVRSTSPNRTDAEIDSNLQEYFGMMEVQLNKLDTEIHLLKQRLKDAQAAKQREIAARSAMYARR